MKVTEKKISEDTRNNNSESEGCGCNSSCCGTDPVEKELQKVNKPFVVKADRPVLTKKPVQSLLIDKSEPKHKLKDKITYIEVANNGYLESEAGNIPKVSHKLTFRDRMGALKVRLNINRDNYRVAPGIYAVGDPHKESPVLVSANYKLSFDHLRSRISGIDAWILVLDTKGINVWCAAGKGTFGTDEIIKRIRISSLDRIVSQRRIILPQLGAPGVAAHIVAKETGFRPVYGPVRAEDIRRFIEAGMKADREMRRVRFGFLNRLVLVPVELTIALKYLLVSIVVILLLSGLSRTGFSLNTLVNNGAISAVLLLLAFITGTVITPLLIPYIPGRAFSFKGSVTGVVLFVVLYFYYPGFNGAGYLELFSRFFLAVSISSFFTMNFTGSTTYTSLSGVMKEMKIAVPAQAVAASAGLVLFIISRFI